MASPRGGATGNTNSRGEAYLAPARSQNSMALLDLVSPWAAAIDAPDSPRARGAFRARHAPLLESLRQQRAPHDAHLALAIGTAALQRLAARAADAEWQQRLRDTCTAASALGADVPADVVLLAGDDRGDPFEALPTARPVAALFVERGDDDALLAALARALAAITRWCARDSLSPVQSGVRDPWDRWARAREISLAEWAYGEGVGLHLAAALVPAREPHLLLGMSRGSYHRLRERERLLQTLFAADLPASGPGVVLRWLAPGAPPATRTIGDVVIPPLAGRYLAWRMTAERVARVGLGEALRMTVDR